MIGLSSAMETLCGQVTISTAYALYCPTRCKPPQFGKLMLPVCGATCILLRTSSPCSLALMPLALLKLCTQTSDQNRVTCRTLAQGITVPSASSCSAPFSSQLLFLP